MVESGGATAADFRDVFKNNIDKRIKNLPEIDGLSKETVLSSWMGKFDAIYFGEDENNLGDGKRGRRNPAAAQSELILSKEQLYDMFQYILCIKRFEHQLLYGGCQVIYLRNKGYAEFIYYVGVRITYRK